MIGEKNKAGGGNHTANHNSPNDHTSNTSNAQRKRLLEALRKRNMTTLQARHKLDILHPGARVFELRKLGHNIVTYRKVEATECGNLHRVAYYVLLGEV